MPIMKIADMGLTIIILLFTIVMHELGHGYMALLMGDTTAKRAGRLTLNPISHLDPMGILAMYFFRFGWAKPVPINPNQFKNYRLGMFLVSIAGVCVNSILAIISAFLLFHARLPEYINDLVLAPLIIYNVGFAVFNMLPFPPLDGSKVLASILPGRLGRKFLEYERYFYVILMALIFSRFLGVDLISKILLPLINGYLNLIMKLVA